MVDLVMKTFRKICAIAIFAILALAPTAIPAEATSTLTQFYTSIRSLQRGVINILSSNATATATITSVTTAKSFIAWGGIATDNAATYATDLNHISCQSPDLVLTNATTVTVTIANPNVACTQTLNVPFTVVEYY